MTGEPCAYPGCWIRADRCPVHDNRAMPADLPARDAASAVAAWCPNCGHAVSHHWPDDERQKPGCHAPKCLCPLDPDQIARANDDRRPAAEAGRADDDGGDALDLDAIRQRVGWVVKAGWALDTDDWIAEAIGTLVRTDVPALLAELAEYRRPGTPTYEQLLASHGQLLNDRDEWARGAREDGAEIERLTRELAEVTRERDEARAKAVDGGEWQWGVRPLDGREDQWASGEAGARDLLASCRRFGTGGFALIRRPVGPVESVTDDGGAP